VSQSRPSQARHKCAYRTAEICVPLSRTVLVVEAAGKRKCSFVDEVGCNTTCVRWRTGFKLVLYKDGGGDTAEW
jgi:hypothetical protein